MIHFLSITIFPVLMIIAGAGDALSLRIPNWLTGLIALLFLPMAYLTGMPLDVFGIHLLTGFGMFFVGFGLFALGLFGGGDAKLIAAAGLWFGWPDIVPFLALTAIAGGILALVIGTWSAISMSTEIHFESWAKRIAGLKPNVPYGYALAIGAILAFPESWWMPVTVS
jgi:prepilin peptidase CpaA